ncbi:MAG: AMP-dependent synthetase [Promethearchaeota archaeon]|nr:MAG: AMP-dependent synthetase [Candidatus Lokiarchaeota archaeon]
MYNERFWKKSWDPEIKDLNPELWETTFVEAIRPTLEELSEKIAFVFFGIELTFGEIDKYSNQFANMLIENNFKPGDVIGINLPNIPECVITYLGTLKAGCIASGISPLLSEIQMQYQLENLGEAGRQVGLITLDIIFANRIIKFASKLSQLKLIITTNIGSFLPKIKQILGKLLKKIPSGKVTSVQNKININFMDILKNYSTDKPEIEITPDDIAFILFTGGTTGQPKGATLTHKNVVCDLIIVSNWLGWERGKGFAVSGFPFFHMGGLYFLEHCLYLGWGQALIPNPRDTDFIVKVIEKYKPTALVNVPSLFQLLLKNSKFRNLDHSNIIGCISAASPFPKESQQELESVVGKGKLIECYGCTETTALTTMNPSKGLKKLGTVGVPMTNIELKLLDPATGEEVSLGDPGEICVRGDMVMKEYYQRPEETKKAIDEEGFMHTGDVGIMDEDGYIRIVDRTKDMIIVSGYKVYSSKLEDILTKHPAIDIIATIGVSNPERPGSELVKAYIKLDPNYSYDGNEDALKADIINYAKEHCAPFEVPKIIEFAEELPYTLIGKIDKKTLRMQNLENK